MLHNIKDVNVNEIEAATDAAESTHDLEETVFSLEEHPEGEYEAEIVTAKETPKFIVVELETSEGLLPKFYAINKANGRTRLDPNMRYLLKAAGVPTQNFKLSSLEGKLVTVTVVHNTNPDSGVTYANIVKIQ